MEKFGKCSVVVVSVMVMLGAGFAQADITITASASAQYSPQQLIDLGIPATQDLQNGDFFISKNLGSPGITGDGWDETTTWSLDFTSDPSYAAFQAAVVGGAQITSASYTLALTTWYQPGPITDVTRIENLFPQFVMPEFLTGSTAPFTDSIVLNLLDNYSSSAMLGELAVQSGKFQMIYADDAVVDRAMIRLTVVPEPTSLLLALPALLLVRSRRRAL